MNKGNKPLTPANALNRAAALCSRSEQAKADIAKKLHDWGLADADAEAVLKRLVDEKFLDDGRYAVAFVRDKFRFNGWGRRKIAYALRQKGLPQDVIDSAMCEIDDADYAAMLRHLLEGKVRSLKGKEPRLAKASLLRFAASRGFEPELFFSMVNGLLGSSEDEDW